ncbi:MAG: helix-turn-helix domain-containing protein [Bacteroidetes bacterium]|nr:helix-turn-helix domain-containing protein [Bacteroidota bacterium]
MTKIPVRHIAPSIKEPKFSGRFSIRDIETLLSGKDMVQELHRHSFFYILALEKGKGEHVIDFVSYTIGDYSVFFMRPGQVHQLKLKNGSKGYLMEFTDDFYTPLEKSALQVLRRVSSRNYCPLDAGRFKKLRFTLAGILEEYSSKQERYREVIGSSLNIFFIELLRQSQGLPSAGDDEYRQERMDELQALIELYAAEHRQVAFYAEKLRLTPYQLNAVTRATRDKTCSELINEHLLLEAKRNLLATSNQVNQIAWELGYEDVSYFIRFFKKHTGQSPEAFRVNFK